MSEAKQPSTRPASQQQQQQPTEQQGEKKKDPRKVGRDLAASPDDFVDAESMYEKGYFGTRDTPFDDEEFALTSGPHSPGERDLADPDSYDRDKSVTDDDD